MDKLTPEEYHHLRNELSLTQGQLASKLGVRRECICRRENGKDVITIEASMALIGLMTANSNPYLNCLAKGRVTTFTWQQ